MSWHASSGLRDKTASLIAACSLPTSRLPFTVFWCFDLLMTGDSVRTCLAVGRAFATAISIRRQKSWPREILHSPTPTHQKRQCRWQAASHLPCSLDRLPQQHVTPTTVTKYKRSGECDLFDFDTGDVEVAEFIQVKR